MSYITEAMIDRAMSEMDKRLLNGDQNTWRDACEIARRGIMFEVLDEAINGAEPTTPSKGEA